MSPEPAMPDYPDTDFDVLDAGRETAEGRVILDEYGFVEAYVAEMDDWTSMPIRVAVSAGTGLTLEIGPYDLDVCDVRLLRRALDGYDRIQATERTLES